MGVASRSQAQPRRVPLEPSYLGGRVATSRAGIWGGGMARVAGGPSPLLATAVPSTPQLIRPFRIRWKSLRALDPMHSSSRLRTLLMTPSLPSVGMIFLSSHPTCHYYYHRYPFVSHAQLFLKLQLI
jgi:hypothetical protein